LNLWLPLKILGKTKREGGNLVAIIS